MAAAYRVSRAAFPPSVFPLLPFMPSARFSRLPAFLFGQTFHWNPEESACRCRAKVPEHMIPFLSENKRTISPKSKKSPATAQAHTDMLSLKGALENHKPVSFRGSISLRAKDAVLRLFCLTGKNAADRMRPRNLDHLMTAQCRENQFRHLRHDLLFSGCFLPHGKISRSSRPVIAHHQ